MLYRNHNQLIPCHWEHGELLTIETLQIPRFDGVVDGEEELGEEVAMVEMAMASTTSATPSHRLWAVMAEPLGKATTLRGDGPLPPSSLTWCWCG
jgi:hypothetical protein